ncbi:MAG: rhamnulose-1-phosphate aldolase [Asgard group archaeon]|nr:rhamnulose-1-phosphate aldolase [Asgard group archaeon]
MSYLYLSQLSNEMRDLISECADVGILLHEKDWAEGNGGNLSIRIDSAIEKFWVSDEDPKTISTHPLKLDFPNINNEYFLFKGAGKRMRDIHKVPDQTLCIGKVVDKDFQVIWPSSNLIKPSSEILSHLAIHNFLVKTKSKQKTVLHTHPTELTALSCMSEIIDSQKLNFYLKGISPSVSIFFPEGIGYVPYEIPSSKKLTEKTMNIIDKFNLIVWAKHGVICKGLSLMSCFDLIDIANKSAKILLAATKFTPTFINEDEIITLESYFHGE